MDFTSWAPGEPNNMDDAEDCVVIRQEDGKWNDISCDLHQFGLCKLIYYTFFTVCSPLCSKKGRTRSKEKDNDMTYLAFLKNT